MYVLVEGVRQFFLCDPVFAACITIGVVTIAICSWNAFVAARDGRKWVSLGLALPAFGLLMVLGTPTGSKVRAHFELVACLSANEPPRWHGLEDTNRPVSRLMLEDAARLAQKILLDESGPCGSWSAAQKAWISAAFERVPAWVDQRQLPDDDSTRLLAVNRDLKIELVAEVSERSRKKICLYPDTLLATFDSSPLVEHGDVHAYLAFLLIHEVCHIAHKCGGFLVHEVAGNPEGKPPPDDHIGLHRWMANLALWCRTAPDLAEAADGAAEFYKRQEILLDPKKGAYGKVLDDRKQRGRLGEGGPPGPPTWHPVPADWDGSNPVGK